jgi:hypothetical protein
MSKLHLGEVGWDKAILSMDEMCEGLVLMIYEKKISRQRKPAGIVVKAVC